MMKVNNSLSKQSWWKDLSLLALLLGVFYALFLGAHALLAPDEGRYCEVAREMVLSGDYITPHLNGVVLLDKPILYYWLQASAIKVFGLNEWALRLWPALFGVFGCLFTYTAGRLLFNRRTGLLAAAILATSPLYFSMAHYANLDLEVAVLISGSLLFFIIAMQYPAGKYRAGFLVAAYICCGLAILAKGMIGIVFPALIIGVWILLLNRWHLLKQMYLFRGLLIVFAVAAPWYILVQKANPYFLNYFFFNQQIVRFLSSDFNNAQPVWFYLAVIAVGFLPWLGFLPQAIYAALCEDKQLQQQRGVKLFLLLWPLLILIFFTIPHSKTIGYITPVMPALALLVGHYLDEHWNNARHWPVRAGIIACLVLLWTLTIGLWIAPHIRSLDIARPLLHYLFAMAIVFLIAALLLLVFFRNKHLTRIFSCLLLSFAVIEVIFIAMAPYLDLASIKPFAATINQYAKANDEVVTYYKYYQDLPVYVQRKITIVDHWDSPAILADDTWRRDVSDFFRLPAAHQWLITEPVFWQRWREKQRIFALVYVDDIKEFKAQAGKDYYQLMHKDDITLVTNKPL